MQRIIKINNGDSNREQPQNRSMILAAAFADIYLLIIFEII